MTPIRSLTARALPGAVLALGAVMLMVLPPTMRVGAEELDRQKKIAAIEKEIADLKAKLDSLKKDKSPAPLDKTKGPASPTLPAEWVKSLNWRSIGPASMGGRIVAFSVYEADPTTYWIATASGGLLKTTNNGVTFEHQFDREATVSIGDVAVAQSDKNIIWVGTGENNPRNSVSFGDGVYKSTDGGKTWKNMGLKKTFQIGRVIVHPKNPDIVYVGALGRLYGPNEDRGLYKTTDGGKTWNKILYVDDRTGVIDMQMSPADPDTLLVATWERLRDGFDSHAGALAGRGFGFGGGGQAPPVNPPVPNGYDAYDPVVKWGKGGGIYKTTDGGKTFKKLAKGLPSNATGRIGMDFYRKDPKVVFAVIDCERIGLGPIVGYLGVYTDDVAKEGGAVVTAVTANSPAEKAGLKPKDVITAVNKVPVKTATDFSREVRKTRPGEKAAFTITREGKPQGLVVTLGDRPGQVAPPRLDFTTAEVKEGLRVATVLANGPSAKAGLQVGDVITEVQSQKVTTSQDLLNAIRGLQAGSKVAVKVTRGKESRQLALLAPERRLGTSNRPFGFMYGGQQPNVQDQQGPDGHEYGGVYRSDDAGETWKRINSANPRPMYFSQVRVDPTDDKKLYLLGVNLLRSIDGGKTFNRGGDAGVHADHHAMWINPRDPRHVLIGTDGGTYVSYDRCEKWDFLNHVAIGQFYHVTFDLKKPYRVFGGLQDNASWGGPNMSLDGRGVVNSDWFTITGGDGFVCRVCPDDNDIVFTESQEGRMIRTNLRTGSQTLVKPIAPSGQTYRFNWNAPMVVSSHNPRNFYCAGNYVFKSVKRGSEPKVISPELTKNAKASATALAESPMNADVLWAGTDDGQLWVTRDGGVNWTNVASKVALPKPFYVATIEPSRTVAGRCYVCFDAHRSDNDDPFIYVTEDYGQTWRSLRGNLPEGSSRCLREDIRNPNVLYLGTEFAAWASIDRGATWTKINNNLPTVAIHELAQHPETGEIVAATHGRSIWIMDATPLRQLKPSTTREVATLLAPGTATQWRQERPRGSIYGTGGRGFFGQGPLPGAQVYYVLTKKVENVSIEVQDVTGKVLGTLTTRNEPGLHRTAWSMRASDSRTGGGRGARGPSAVPAGAYRVVMKVTENGKVQEQIQALKVENDPNLPTDTIITEAPPREKRATRSDD